MQSRVQLLRVQDLVVGFNRRTILPFFERKVESQEFLALWVGLAFVIFMGGQRPEALPVFALVLAILWMMFAVHRILSDFPILKRLSRVELRSVNFATNHGPRGKYRHPLQVDSMSVQKGELVEEDSL